MKLLTIYKRWLPIEMTRNLLLIIIISLSGQNRTELIEGTFCNSDPYHLVCYTFSENGRFEMTYSDCTDFRYGIGTFEILNYDIILNFNRDTLHQDKSHFKANTSQTNSDSIGLIIETFELNGEPIFFTNVTIIENFEKVIAGGSTDEKGQLKLRLPKDKKFVDLRVTSSMYKDIITPIDLKKNTEIKFYLDDKKTLIEDTTVILKYRRIANDKIIFRSGTKLLKE